MLNIAIVDIGRGDFATSRIEANGVSVGTICEVPTGEAVEVVASPIGDLAMRRSFETFDSAVFHLLICADLVSFSFSHSNDE